MVQFLGTGMIVECLKRGGEPHATPLIEDLSENGGQLIDTGFQAEGGNSIRSFPGLLMLRETIYIILSDL